MCMYKHFAALSSKRVLKQIAKIFVSIYPILHGEVLEFKIGAGKELEHLVMPKSKRALKE